MLKITERSSAGRVCLELEGRLAGAWVVELENSWRSLAATLAGRELQVDLTQVESVDASGRYLLALMHHSGARLLASGCMMLTVVEQIAGTWPAGMHCKARIS